MGSLRHSLTDKLREVGGHVDYAIHQSERNKGYGTLLLKVIIEKANEERHYIWIEC